MIANFRQRWKDRSPRAITAFSVFALAIFAISSYAPGVRLLYLCGLICLLADIGCFQPNVANGGFRCQPNDNPACPKGFYCVNGYCVNQPGMNVGGNGGAGGNGGFGGMGGGGSGGGGMGGGGMGGNGGDNPDLSMDPPDLSQPPDMRTSNCSASGAICTGNANCCSNVCFFLVCL